MAHDKGKHHERPPDGAGMGGRVSFQSRLATAIFGFGPAGSRKRPRNPAENQGDGPSEERKRPRSPDRHQSQVGDQKHRQKRHHRHRHEGKTHTDDKHHGRPRHHHSPHAAPRRITLELKCLDERYLNITSTVASGFPASRLESLIRYEYTQQRRPISTHAVFTFYSDGEVLGIKGQQFDGPQTIWYRMGKQAVEPDGWKVTPLRKVLHYGEGSSSLAGELVQALESGDTVLELRRKIANSLDIQDPNRIVLIARGGTRPGVLQGNDWQASQIQMWFCRWLSYDVMPEKGYVVLKAPGREYVYHPEPRQLANAMDLRALKSHLKTYLLSSVCRSGKSGLDISRSEISLGIGGRLLRSSTPVRWGETYVLMIPLDAAEIFADEETWLLAPTTTCAVCADDKRVSELPISITSVCNHDSTTCKDCLRQWLQSSLETNEWNRLKCPDCPGLLQYPDVKRYASPETFERYDTLATRAALEDIPNFRWCLSTTCDSGYIHDGTCPKFKCQKKKCGTRHCVKHEVLWHEGETCDQYDRRHQQRKKDEKATEQMIKNTSKKCPKCTKDVHKWSGCNHITCICGHEWCYVCFKEFERTPHGLLFCRHNQGCTERDPVVELLDNQHRGAPIGFDNLDRPNHRGMPWRPQPLRLRRNAVANFEIPLQPERPPMRRNTTAAGPAFPPAGPFMPPGPPLFGPPPGDRYVELVEDRLRRRGRL